MGDVVQLSGRLGAVLRKIAVEEVAAWWRSPGCVGICAPHHGGGREWRGRDATDPGLLVGLWWIACIRGLGSAAGSWARRCEERRVR